MIHIPPKPLKPVYHAVRKYITPANTVAVGKTLAQIAFPGQALALETGYQIYKHRKEASQAISLINQGNVEESIKLAAKTIAVIGIEKTQDAIIGQIVKDSADIIIGNDQKNQSLKKVYSELMETELTQQTGNAVTSFLGEDND